MKIDFEILLNYEEYKEFESLLKEPARWEKTLHMDDDTYSKYFLFVIGDSVFKVKGPLRE